MKLVTAAQMRELDRQAIEDLGIPSLVLMENAGRTTYRILRREFPALTGGVAVLAGRGNNGGDGFVVARYLANAGESVAVFLLGQRDEVRGDARVNLEIITQIGVEVIEVLDESHLNPVVHRLAWAGLIVDALLGIGLNSPVAGLMAALIEKVNHLRPPVLAVDIPSGLCADTGRPLGAAVMAQVTATYGWPKIGQVLPPGRDYVGRLWQVDIGIPPALARDLTVEWAEAEDLRRLLPPRPWGSHKGNFGHLAVVAGSEGKTGAAALTAAGGLRAGAGLVTLGIPASLNDILEAEVTEAMTLPLPEAPGVRALGAQALAALREFLTGKTAVALGPGLGTHEETRGLVRQLARHLPLPMVIDADGVNALAPNPDWLKDAPGPRILTPHPGEMARLTGLSAQEIQADRIQAAREAAARYGAVIVLKGAQTVVADPEGRVSLNGTGNPALASGGTGDVLTGLIGGFLAQKMTPWDAARLGVYLHGLAADYLAGGLDRGLIAGDLLAGFQEMLGEFLSGRIPLEEEDVGFRRLMM
ncbi:MAG: NAD(P)H-hydrate dehydratase [Deltaproteobacteria bacterium]|nr:NAD(P)H-hydrate dehydratase [Deltaproteobacteria bacterium]